MDLRPGAIAFFLYAALTVVMTWPLTPGIARDVPGDLGDSLLNMWILGWGAEHVPRLLTGQATLADYFNANIFHPEPLALGFSEHLFGEVLQILPLYWLTGNLILCYNVLFLASFALSGLAMFLFACDLLEDHAYSRPTRLAAAFVAGLVFAFVPFRVAQVAHIQSLHAYWMPFALLGFRRYIRTRRWLPLAGGAFALLMQNWSNGYYLLYFAPFVVLFVLHQVWSEGRLRDARLWAGFMGAGMIVAAGTVPLLTLYLQTQRVHAFERPLGEVVRFSADVYSYLTAPQALRVWGEVMQVYPKPEGELFFGAVPWLLAACAVIVGATHTFGQRVAASSRSLVTLALLAVIAIQSVGIAAIMFTGGFITSLGGIPVRATNASRLMAMVALATVLMLVMSREMRERALVIAKSPVTLCTAFVLLALWLSLGPLPQSFGRGLAGLGLYRVLYDYVPGYAGLRVPARYAMIAALFLAVVAGFGFARLASLMAQSTQRATTALALCISAIFLGEAWFAPMPVNVTWGSGYAAAPPRVFPATDAPAVYHQLANLRDDAIVMEFPFGDITWELRYVYYSTVHWRRLVNGYSGGFPHGYRVRAALLQRLGDDPAAAWQALKDAGTTHVVVHRAAFPAGGADVVTKWLTDHFAVEIARFEDDLLFDVTGVWPPR